MRGMRLDRVHTLFDPMECPMGGPLVRNHLGADERGRRERPHRKRGKRRRGQSGDPDSSKPRAQKRTTFHPDLLNL